MRASDTHIAVSTLRASYHPLAPFPGETGPSSWKAGFASRAQQPAGGSSDTSREETAGHGCPSHTCHSGERARGGSDGKMRVADRGQVPRSRQPRLRWPRSLRLRARVSAFQSLLLTCHFRRISNNSKRY